MERHAHNLLIAAMFIGGAALAGCLAPASNDGLLPPLPGFNPDAGTGSTPGVPTTPGTTNSGNPTTPTTPGAPATPGAMTDSGLPGADAASPPTTTGLLDISGSGAACYTYSARAGDKCFGKFCGVTATQIDSALVKPRIGRCPLVTPEFACQGLVIQEVGKCARSVRSQEIVFNPFITNAQLRPKVQECVYKNTAIDMNVVTPDCLGCYLDSAECSGDNCLDACILGDSPDCDACREAAGCNNPVAACAGFPDPR